MEKVGRNSERGMFSNPPRYIPQCKSYVDLGKRFPVLLVLLNDQFELLSERCRAVAAFRHSAEPDSIDSASVMSTLGSTSAPDLKLESPRRSSACLYNTECMPEYLHHPFTAFCSHYQAWETFQHRLYMCDDERGHMRILLPFWMSALAGSFSWRLKTPDFQ